MYSLIQAAATAYPNIALECEFNTFLASNIVVLLQTESKFMKTCLDHVIPYYTLLF